MKYRVSSLEIRVPESESEYSTSCCQIKFSARLLFRKVDAVGCEKDQNSRFSHCGLWEQYVCIRPICNHQ
jgi:hypothetical protein